jgi:hypothetical protein
MKQPMIPTNFEQWKHCIVKECGIPLTSAFVNARLEAMNDANNEYTRQFVKCYGNSHYENTMRWLNQAKENL